MRLPWLHADQVTGQQIWVFCAPSESSEWHSRTIAAMSVVT
jgi:hypothetical protein